MKIALISCAKNKKDYECSAEDVYISALFTKAKEYVSRREYDAWFILSAKYGLLNPKELITPYDVTLNSMNREERMVWSSDVFCRLTKQNPNVVDFYAGKKYREFLIPMLEEVDIQCNVPLAGLGIGQQLSFYVRSMT